MRFKFSRAWAPGLSAASVVAVALVAAALAGGTTGGSAVGSLVQASLPVGPAVAAKASPNPVGVRSLVTLGESIRGGASPFTYTWTAVSVPVGSTAVLSSASDAQPTFTADRPGLYEWSLTVTDSLARVSQPAVVAVQASLPVGPAVAAKASPNPVGVGSFVTLGESIRGGVSPFSYTWAVVSVPVSSTAVLSSASDAHPTFTPDVPGLYQWSLTVTDTYGRVSAPALVGVQATVPSGPTGAAKASPNPVGVGSPVTLGETVRGGVGPFIYSWAVVSIPVSSTAALSSASDAHPTFTPDVPGIYQWSLTLTDTYGRVSPPAVVWVQATLP